MSPIWLIATNTYRQILRQKVFYNVLLFGLGMVMLSMLVGNITFGFPDRVVRSIGLSGICIALDLLALLTGVGLIHGEVDRKSIYVVLTRPVGRAQYVIGRFLGLLGTLVLIALGLFLVFALILSMVRGSLTVQDLMAVLGSLVEACVLGGVALIFSTFTTPTLGAGLGLGVWIIAASNDDLVGLSAQRPELAMVTRAISFLFPNFARLNFRENAVYALETPIGDWALALTYGGIYCLIATLVASLVLYRRELL